MEYWPWWISGLALSGVMLFHWFTLRRMMAVSGRVTAVIDYFRHGSVEPEQPMSPEEMLAAIQAATDQEFGPEDITLQAPTVDAAPAAGSAGPPLALPAVPLPPRTNTQHALFMGGLVLGGFVATAIAGDFAPTASLAGDAFNSLTGGNKVISGALLALGGAFVGFGTRMSGGCTSGHGLCGTSRMQPGSLAATASFFGAGIAASFFLGSLL